MAKTSSTPKGLRRKYKGTDSQMATVLLAILKNATDRQPDLAKRRSRYTPAFFTTLSDDLAAVIREVLGLDPHALVQGLTATVVEKQTEARLLISALNRDLIDGAADAGLSARLPELRAQLGLRDHFDGVQRGNQQSTSQFLTQFAAATDAPTVYDELTKTLDISAAEVVDKLRALRSFITLDSDQEAAKGTARVVTAEGQTRLNDIYNRLMRVSGLGRSHYKAQGLPATADLFSYSAVRRKMTGGQPTPPPTQ